MESSANISKKRKVCEEKETPSMVTSSVSEGFQHPPNLQKEQRGESSQDSCDIKRVNTEPKAGTLSEAERKKKKKETSMVTSSVSEEGFQHPPNLQKKQSGENSQHSCDIKRVNTEPKAGTSSAAEIIVQPVCTKADYSHATISKSHSFDPESSSVNSEESANTQEDDAYASTDSMDQMPHKTIDEALRREYNLMCDSLSSFDENHTIFRTTAAFCETTDGHGIIESLASIIRILSPSDDQILLDDMEEDYPEYEIGNVFVTLIRRVIDIIYDMNKLHKDMEEKPFWTPLIKKGYDACCYDAGRSLRYRINDRIIKSTLTKWSNIKFGLSRLSQWLNKAVLLFLNVIKYKDRIISVNCVRQMIVIVLKNGGLREISNNLGDILVTYPSDNITFIKGVKERLTSIITRLMSVVECIEIIQENT